MIGVVPSGEESEFDALRRKLYLQAFGQMPPTHTHGPESWDDLDQNRGPRSGSLCFSLSLSSSLLLLVLPNVVCSCCVCYAFHACCVWCWFCLFSGIVAVVIVAVVVVIRVLVV